MEGDFQICVTPIFAPILIVALEAKSQVGPFFGENKIAEFLNTLDIITALSK
jgi:hypothetical protein